MMKTGMIASVTLTLSALAAPATAATVEIPIQNFQFGASNATVTVNVGDTVRWTDMDPDSHTVTSGASRTSDGKFDSGNLNQNDVFTHTFTQAGTFPYFCSYHVGMESAIEVKAAGKTVTIDIKGFKFGNNNAPVTIQVGDSIEWRNLDTGVQHTVTSGLRTDADQGSLFDHAFIGNAGNPPTFTFTFTKAGTYPYHCRPHTTMNSSIIVQAPAAVNGDVNGDGVVDQTDVVLALQVLGGLAALPDGAMARSDVSPTGGDGVFDMRDAWRILRFVDGTDTTPL